MDSSQTLEMQILAKSDEALKSLDKLIKKLSGVEIGVENINEEITKINNDNIKDITREIDNVDVSTKKATKSMGMLKNTFTFSGIKKLIQEMIGWMDTAIDQTEQLNLFNVVFDNVEKNGTKMYSKLGKEAIKFQYQMNESFATNKTQTLKYQALYQSMAENMGIGKEYSAIMSESMTKLTYDLASLYNKSDDTTAEALRASVYAGQTKPGRSYGLDTTQQSLQPILDDLGIERTVKQMSQAEKQILRYLAVMKQSQVAHGDFANTIESPANQLKIFKQQLVETKVAVSSLFIGVFSNILPYANAILMVIKEVSLAIANMFGIELTDYNSGIATQEDAYKELEESVDGATGAVKELKRQTLGFDQINNINEDSNSNNSGAMAGGIDQRLLEAIHGYNNGMNDVKMKALQIRDVIMNWLGFTIETSEETEKVSFKLRDGFTNIKLIGGILTGIIGLKIAKKLENIINMLTGSKLFGTIKNIGTAIGEFSKNTMSAKEILDTTFPSLGSFAGSFSSLASALGISVPVLGAIVATITAIAGILVHAYNTSDTFRDKVNEMVSTVSELFGILYENITIKVQELWQFIEPLWNIIKTTTETIFGGISTTITTIFNNIADTISGIANVIIDIINGDFNKAWDDAKGIIENVRKNWEEWKNQIASIFSDWVIKITDYLKQFISNVKDKLGEMLNWFIELPGKMAYWLGYGISSLWKLITETNWKEFGSNIINGIISGISSFGTKIWDFVKKLYDEIKTVIEEIDWGSIGKNILNAIKNGMLNIGNTLVGWGQQFIKGIKDALGIHSPSQLVIDNKIGNYTTDGILVGMNKEVPKVRETAEDMVNEINEIFANGNYLTENSMFNNSNNDISNSLITGIYSAVMNGISQYGKNCEIDVHVHTDEGTVVDRINKKTKQTGVCPIQIPV